MLIPDNCAVVLVDAATSSSSRTALEMIVSRVQRLIEVANIIHVPIVLAHYPTSAAHGILSARITLPAPPQSFPLLPKHEAWSSTDLGKAIAATCRNQVVIAGFWLEEAVTLLTLNCLSVGFDTYVVGDATAVIDFAQEQTARSRLRQAGTVPTSTEQIIREWVALLEDVTQAAYLIACVQSRAQN